MNRISFEGKKNRERSEKKTGSARQKNRIRSEKKTGISNSLIIVYPESGLKSFSASRWKKDNTPETKNVVKISYQLAAKQVKKIDKPQKTSYNIPKERRRKK